jgi:hypothetical protein
MNVFISYSQADREFAERLRSGIQALGANVRSDESGLKPGESWDPALREALAASDGVVLVIPEPGTPKANAAFFEAGAARALGKPLVAVLLTSPEPNRVRELPSDLYGGLAVFEGSRVEPKALAKNIVSTLNVVLSPEAASLRLRGERPIVSVSEQRSETADDGS